jgi:hypothetical protein
MIGGRQDNLLPLIHHRRGGAEPCQSSDEESHIPIPDSTLQVNWSLVISETSLKSIDGKVIENAFVCVTH